MRIGVIGFGYVGRGLAIGFARAGIDVLCIDESPGKLVFEDTLNCRGGGTILSMIRSFAASGRMVFSTNYEQLSTVDFLAITVQTPLDSNDRPDLSHVDSATEKLMPYLRVGQAICLESTTYPGTTRKRIAGKIAAALGWEAGREYFLGYSPERINPGDEIETVFSTAKLISGVTAACLTKIEYFYSNAFTNLVRVQTCDIAEGAKLLENAYRLVNIGFVNEMRENFAALGIPFDAVLDAAATKPFGFTRFSPGLGAGGHCIPVAPHYLMHAFGSAGMRSAMLEAAVAANNRAVNYALDALCNLLSDNLQSAILFCGITYKADVEDVRESRALILLRKMLDVGFRNITVHDPLADPKSAARVLSELPVIHSRDQPSGSYDIVVIAAPHRAFASVNWKTYSNMVFHC